MNIAKFKEAHAQKIRFAMVGAANTVLDFTVFFALSSTVLPPVAANYVSTTIANASSFLANKKYTFKVSGKKLHHEITLFVIFSVIGLWVIQPIVILICSKTISGNMPHWLFLLASKSLATCFSLVWNYLTYSRYVFTD